jgi:hypothetical protein
MPVLGDCEGSIQLLCRQWEQVGEVAGQAGLLTANLPTGRLRRRASLRAVSTASGQLAS